MYDGNTVTMERLRCSDFCPTPMPHLHLDSWGSSGAASPLADSQTANEILLPVAGSHKGSSSQRCHWLVRLLWNANALGPAEKWQVGIAPQIYHWPDVPLERKTISRLSDNFNTLLGKEEISPSLHSGSSAERGNAHIKISTQGCLVLKYPAFHGLMRAPPD